MSLLRATVIGETGAMRVKHPLYMPACLPAVAHIHAAPTVRRGRSEVASTRRKQQQQQLLYAVHLQNRALLLNVPLRLCDVNSWIDAASRDSPALFSGVIDVLAVAQRVSTIYSGARGWCPRGWCP